MQITLRLATLDDTPIIVDLIHELAAFEQLPALEKAQLENNMRKNGFSQNAAFECVLAYVDNQLAGYMLYCFPFRATQGKSYVYLEDIYVRASFRRQKIATHMMRQLAQTAIEKDCCCVTWNVLKWNERAQSFYQVLGAIITDTSLRVAMHGKSLECLAKLEL